MYENICKRVFSCVTRK